MLSAARTSMLNHKKKIRKFEDKFEEERKYRVSLYSSICRERCKVARKGGDTGGACQTYTESLEVFKQCKDKENVMLLQK